PTAIPTSIVNPTKAPVPTTVPTTAPQPTSVPAPTQSGAQGETFVKGINFNGGAETILGHAWLSYSSALGQGLTVTGAVPDNKGISPNPETDAATSQMLNTLIYAASDPGSINITQVLPNGTYHLYLWTMENYAGNQRRWNLNAEGIPLANNL